jgi:ABC-type branched-subunit amino acid transport system ATPase component/branched-subunit amino acid ABC-type transport system permease component
VQEFLSLVTSGAVSGAVFSIVAAGLVLSYTVSGIFNFGYGAIAFSCAYLFYELNTGVNLPVVIAALITLLLFAPLLGLLLDRLIFRGLWRADDAPKIVATIGLSVALPALAMWIVEELISVFKFNLPKGDNVVLPPGLGPSPAVTWHVLSVVLDSDQAIILISAIVAAAALWYLVRHTRLGLRMRATVDRSELAELRGIDSGRTRASSWILGVMLAAIAGVVAAPIFTLAPASYTQTVFVAATAAVMAGLRSVPLALVGGLVLGIAQNLVAGYATFASGIVGFSTSVPFVFLLLALVVFARTRGRVAGSTVAGEVKSPEIDTSDLPRWRRAAPLTIAAVLLLTFVAFVADDFWLGLVAEGLAMAIIFLSFTVVVGMGGMVSLSQATFVTMSGLIAGLLLAHGAPFAIALVAGVFAAVLAGVIVAVPALRIGGLALALATLALGLLGDEVLFAWTPLSNDPLGWQVTPPSLGFINLSDYRSMAYFLFVVLLLVVWVVRNLQRSATGRKIQAVRSSGAAASMSGTSPFVAKFTIFAVSAGIAGLGGVLLATVNQNVTNQSTPSALGLTWLAVVVLFGVRRAAGAVVAGLVIAMSPTLIGYVTSSTLVPQMLFGLGAIGLAQNPDGALADFARNGRRLRERRRRSAARRQTQRDRSLLASTDDMSSPTDAPTQPDVATADAIPAEVSEPGLAVRGVSASYGSVAVLYNISLNVRPGKVLALLGANGAGKSTLCSVLSGGHPMSHGRLFLDGVELTGYPGYRRAREGMLVAPESRGIFPTLTVDENLSVWLQTKQDRDAAYVQFPALARRRKLAAGSLSGGEQQMLTLATVVVRPPRVLIIDEPTLGLAPLIGDQVMAVIARLAESGVSVLLVEEKSRRALEIASTVALLQLGRIVWTGLRADVDADQVMSTYLGTAAEPVA